MTISADINVLTGVSFSSAQVYGAVQAAFRIISGYIENTVTENDNESLDTAALILARKILERGRISAKQKIQDSPADYVDNVIPKEVKEILDNYLLEDSTYAWHKNEQPSTHSPGTTFWRSSI